MTVIHLQMNKPNPNCTFIDIKYKDKSYDAYIDTGATLCFASAKIPFRWNKLKKPKRIRRILCRIYR